MSENVNREAEGPFDEAQWLDATMNTPYDAANRRAKRLAHIEHTKRMSAFHDGANTPEIKAAIDRAREKILKRIKAKQASNAELSDSRSNNL